MSTPTVKTALGQPSTTFRTLFAQICLGLSSIKHVSVGITLVRSLRCKQFSHQASAWRVASRIHASRYELQVQRYAVITTRHGFQRNRRSVATKTDVKVETLKTHSPYRESSLLSTDIG